MKVNSRIRKFTDAEAGFLAGYLLADGCIRFYLDKKPRVEFDGCDKEFLERVREIIGVPKLFIHHTANGYPYYKVVIISSQEIIDILQQIKPYLVGVKREKAERAIEISKNTNHYKVRT